MRSILISITILLIILLLWSFHGPIVVIKRRLGERKAENEKEPETINQYLAILGLKPGASQEEIIQAYKDLVNVWHPDRFVNNQRLQKRAEEKLKEINASIRLHYVFLWLEIITQNVSIQPTDFS